MRLSPRSRRGTWLLAGAAWLAACAGLWAIRPVVPRDLLRIPGGSELLGFGPGGTTALVQRSDSSPAGVSGRLDLVAVPSGEIVASWDDKSARLAGQSADGRIWVFFRDPSFFKLDLTEPAFALLAIPPTKGDYDDHRGVTTDGRFFLFNEDTAIQQTTVWDLVLDRRHGSIADFVWPNGFDADGKPFLFVCSPFPSGLSLIDPDRLCVVAIVAAPDEGAFNNLNGYWPAPRFAGGAVITHYTTLKVFDPATESMRFALSTRPDDFDVSLDGRTIWAVERYPYNILDSILNWFGISSSFARRDHSTVRLHSLSDGSELGTIVAARTNSPSVRWLPGQQAVATMDPDDSSVWQIWDIPPSKSFTWFAAGAVLLALPIGFVACWRVRRLRAA